jgi:hypothetical protein
MYRSWRKKLEGIILVAVLLIGLVPVAQAASAPNIFTYQGRVLNANGVPVTDASLSMIFELYTASSGGSCVWSNSSTTCASATARSVTLTTGLFTENLGDTSNSYAAIADSIFGDNSTLYLQVTIAGELLSPRRLITAAPYAFNADTLDGIDSATLQLFETGSSRTFEDDAPVIIGSNAAFTYGSGATGDLRIDDEIEVMGDGYIDNDLVVGASTSSTETITNGSFSLGGDDLFVAGDAGIEGTLYIDGAINLVGTATVGDLSCTNCLDFTELSDTLALDASTSIAMDGSETFTITDAGTGNVVVNLSSTGDFVIQDNGTAAFTVNDSGNTILAGDLTITGDDLFMGTNTSGFILVADGTNYNPVAVSGDVTLSSAGAITIAANSVALTTDTTGNYVATLADAGNSTVTVTNGSTEGGAATIDVIDLNCTNCIGATEISDLTLGTDTAGNYVASVGTSVLTGLTGGASGSEGAALTLALDYSQALSGDVGLSANAGVFGSSGFVFEGSTADTIETFISITDPTVSDKTITLPNLTGTVILSGHTFTGDVTATVGASNTTALTVAADSVALSTDTTGNYVATLADAGGSDFTITGSGSEGAAVTIDIADDAIDWDEIVDTMTLDASTSIAMDGSESFTFTNGGTSNVIVNLSSTGDFVVQDNGAAVLTIADDDVLSYTTDLTTTNASTFTGNSLTTGNLFSLSSTSLTTGSALTVTATNANTANSASRLSQFTFTNAQATVANDNVMGMILNFTNNPSIAGNTERVFAINNQATSNTTDNAVSALLALDNADTSTTGSTVVNDAISITVSGTISGGIIDAIDATDSNITNALNFGTNTILGSTGNIDMDNFDVTGSTGLITTAGDLAVNGDDITADGVLTIDAASTIQLGTDDDFLPQLGAGDADIGATGTRWDTVFATAGNFSGTATVGDLSCTDCLDFAEFSDAMALDASTGITMDSAEVLTFTNGGTGDIIVNLSSTGDFVVQDNGTAVFTLSDTGTILVDPTSTGTILDFELATQWTTGDLINVDWASATTATGAATGMNLDFTNFTPDGAAALYGILLNDQASATASTEYGLYIEGSNWDRALYVEDVSEFREDVVIDDATDGVDVVIGSDNTNVIDLGADVFSAGTFIDIAYDTAEVLTSTLIGLNMDFNTSVTGASGVNVTGARTLLPTLTASGTSTTAYVGYQLDSSGGLDTTDASVTAINWSGFRLNLPNIDTGDAADTVRSTGLEIIGGTVTNGAGTEDEIGIDLGGTKIDLDADNDTSVVASTDDRIDWELGGVSQTLIMSAPATAGAGLTRSILDINYATPADGSGTNIHQGLTIDMDIGNATAGTNTVNGIAIEAMTGDAQVANVHGLAIGAFTGSGATNETAFEVGAGWDAALSFLDTSAANLRILNSSSFVFQDASGNGILTLVDVGNSANHVITLDSNTALAFDSNDDTDTDITTANNEQLRIVPAGTGDTFFGIDADSNVQAVATAAPGVSMMMITNSGFSTATEDVNALSILHSVTGVTNSAIDITPSYTGGGTDARTYQAISISSFSPTNAAGVDTIMGMTIEALTDPGATISSYGLQIASGWDTQLYFNDTSSVVEVANGGIITFVDGDKNTLMVLTDSGTTGTLTIEAITNTAGSVDLFDNTVTKTIDIGGVTSSASDTINIATNGTIGDTISIGNSTAGTNITLTAGGTIDLEGAVTMDLAAIGATQFALCHTNADTDDEPIGDCSGAPTADYAEQYPVAAGIEYGDIVVPGTKKVTTTEGDQIVQLLKSSRAYQGPVVGIVSNNYGDFTSAGYNINEEDNPMPVALVGRVPVKVTNEGGAINVGDYLTTSSTPGKAMKATKAGRVIGMALQAWDGVSPTVMVQVNNSWSLGDVLAADGTSSITTNNVIVSSVATATAKKPTFNSYGLALRGSAWNGTEAEAVQLMMQNVVESKDAYRLSIRNTAESEVAYITNQGTMKIAGNMIIGGNLYPSDRGKSQTEKYIYYDGSSGAAGDFMRTNAKGWSTGSYDFAEMFPSGESLTSGDIVAFTGSGEAVARATGAPTERLAGIVSTRPGFLAGENVAGAYPIALAGRVPTKVSLENGAIAVGDPLTSSTKVGVAMKATQAGQIIGYALETYVGTESDNLILTYVNLGYWSGGPQTITIVQNVASEVPTGSQGYSSLNMSGNIFMATNSILSIGRLEGMGAIWSVESDGTIKTQGELKTVTDSYQGTKIETVAVTSPQSVITLTGTATLVDGKAEVRFEDVRADFNDVISAIAPIRVIVTPSGPVSLYVSEKDQNHFIVQRFAGSADVEFDWMVTGYRKGYEPEEEEVEVQSEVSDPSVPSVLSDLSVPDLSEPVEEPASPESPDTTIVDSATDVDGGLSAEPADVVIEE